MTNPAEQKDYDALLRQALLSLKKAQARIAALEEARREPIAIVGMACRFPGGADDPQAFWRLLCDGADAIGEVPADRWDAAAFYDPDPAAPGKTITRWGGFLDGVDRFDAGFFGIANREARWMDPQQRLLLEVSWEALEEAGLTREALAGSRTGVYVGVMGNDYNRMQMADARQIDAYAAAGLAQSIIANRVSYMLDLHGPSVAVDTACSSSLTALHMACAGLRAGECDAALAGGVNLILLPEMTVACTKWRMLAPDGRCKVFDASADGFVRSEGCGVLVLKRLSDARRSGDRILALIRGTAVNQDGRSSGLTAPNVLAQQQVIRQALDQAGVDPAAVGYIETHGTGTSLGDPIEVAALGEVYGPPRADGAACLLGAVKANIGHLESAAGVAGVIKAVLALQGGAIPPQIHFSALNPNITLEQTRFVIPTALTPWARGDAPRYAGVSSFGIGGTNAHIVLEEAPPQAETASDAQPPYALPISAHSPEALRELAGAYHALLGRADAPALADLTYSAGVRRSHQAHRLAVVGEHRAELAEELAAWLAGAPRSGVAAGQAQPGRSRGVVFVYTGMGPQWWAMGRQLLAEEPVFRAAVERCAEALARHADWSLLDELLADEASSRMHETRIAQPANFAIQVGLTELWRAWGVTPSAIVGHSAGEAAACYAAGVLSLDEAARVIVHRSRLQHQTSGQGTMVALGIAPEQARSLIAGHEAQVSIAAVNSPASVTLAGDPATLAALVRPLQEQQVFCRFMQVAVPYHSHYLDPLRDELLASLQGLECRSARVPLYSSVTGRLADGAELDAGYWWRNVRATVQFADAAAALAGEGYDLFVEVGPHPVLAGALGECLAQAGRQGAVLPSLRRNEAERATLLRALGGLYAQGYPVDWARLHPQGGRLVRLPGYPWQRERHWIDARPLPAVSAARGGHPLLGDALTLAGAPELRYWEQVVGAAQPAFLADHQVQGVAVLPGAAYVELALAAAGQVWGAGGHALRDLRFRKLLSLPPAAPRALQLRWLARGDDQASVQVFSRALGDATAAWEEHASGELLRGQVAEAAPQDPAALAAACPSERAPDDYYAELAAQGLGYGPAFRGIAALRQGRGAALAEVCAPAEVQADAAGYLLHPALLDACFQTVAALTPAEPGAGVTLPVGLRRLDLLRAPQPAERLLVTATQRAAASPGLSEADLRVLDASGAPLLVVEGLQLMRLGADGAPDDELAQWLYGVEWRALEAAAPAPGRPPAEWLIFDDGGGLGGALAQELAARGGRAVLVERGERYTALAADRYQLGPADRAGFARLLGEVYSAGRPACQAIIYLWGLAASAADAQSASPIDQALTCDAPLALVQALAHAGWRDMPRLWLITRGAEAVEPSDGPPALAQTPLGGLSSVIAHEFGQLRCSRADLDAAPGADEPRELAELLLADPREDRLALRGGRRAVARLARQAVGVRGQVAAFPADATYLISGGLGGIGLSLARRMVERGARSLVLLGRRAPAAEARAALDELRAAGATVRVAQVDVADRAALASLLEELREGLPPLRGVVHAAGVLDDGLLLQQTPERFRDVLAPKVAGAWNLHQLTRELPIDIFVLFSSATSILGSPGQGNYAAANAFLDGLAAHRRAQGLPALSVNWGPWAEVGMAAQAERAERIGYRGLRSMAPGQALDALERLLGGAPAQIGVFPFNLRQWLQYYPRAAEMSLFAELLATLDQASAGAAGTASLRRELEAAAPAQRAELLERHLYGLVERVLRVPAERLTRDTPLGSVGLDSLMALEIRNLLEDSLGTSFPVTLIWNYQTVGALAGYLAGALELAAPAPEAAEPPAPPPAADEDGDELARLLSAINDLSLDQLQQALDPELLAQGEANE